MLDRLTTSRVLVPTPSSRHCFLPAPLRHLQPRWEGEPYPTLPVCEAKQHQDLPAQPKVPVPYPTAKLLKTLLPPHPQIGSLSDRLYPPRETMVVVMCQREASLAMCAEDSSHTSSASYTIAGCFPGSASKGVHIPSRETVYFPTKGDTWHSEVKPRPGPCLLD